MAFQVAEAMVEGTEKAREIQLAAAADTRTWLEAARKSFDPQVELLIARVHAPRLAGA